MHDEKSGFFRIVAWESGVVVRAGLSGLSGCLGVVW